MNNAIGQMLAAGIQKRLQLFELWRRGSVYREYKRAKVSKCRILK